MSSISRIQLESWIKTITNVSGKVLDIGGSQLSIIKRLNKEAINIDEYKILDLEKPHDKKENVDIVCDLNDSHALLDFYNINSIPDTLEERDLQHDIAFCIEVSEYWWNPITALRNIKYLLKKDGILYISFHFVYPVHNPVDQDYIRYTPRGCQKMLEETGFKILEMKPRTLKTIICHIDGMRPSKTYDKHDWQGCLIKCQKI